MGLWLPGEEVWTEQPQELVGLSSSGPFAGRIAFLAPLHPGWGLRDLVSGRGFVPSSPALTRVASGPGIYPLFGTEYVDVPFDIEGITGSTPIAIAWTQEPRSPSGYATILNWKPAGASYTFLIYQGPAASGYEFAVGPRNSAVPYFSAIGAPVDGRRDNFVLLCLAGTDSANPADYVLIRNGVRYTTAATTSFGTNTSAAFRIGAREGGSDPFKGPIANVHIIRGIPLDDESSAWCANEYSTLAPVAAPTPEATAGGGGSTQYLTLAASATTSASRAIAMQASRAASGVAAAARLAQTSAGRAAASAAAATVATLKAKLVTFTASVTGSAALSRATAAVRLGSTASTTTLRRSTTTTRSAAGIANAAVAKAAASSKSTSSTSSASIATLKAKLLTLAATVGGSAALGKLVAARRQAALTLASVVGLVFDGSGIVLERMERYVVKARARLYLVAAKLRNYRVRS